MSRLPSQGNNKATWTVAVFSMARRLAVLVYRMLRYGQDYVDMGEEYYEARFRKRRLAGLTDAAKSLGFKLVPQTAAA